jgi:hypothetical protein
MQLEGDGPIRAEHWECSNDEYHRSPGISNSMISTFIENPETFHQQYLQGDAVLKKSSVSLAFGTRIGQMLEFTRGYADRLMACPPKILNAAGRMAGPTFNEFARDNSDKMIMSVDRFAEAEAVCLQVEANELASNLLATSQQTEYSIRFGWQDLICRVRPDFVHPACIVDVKTARSAEAGDFARSIEKWGYHRQAALYRLGYQMLTDTEQPFVFLVIQNSPPYTVSTFDIDPAWLRDGMKEVLDALAGIRECLANGQWHRPEHNKVITLSRPEYAKTQPWKVE